MSTLQELTNRQANEAIRAAVERRIPMTVTIPVGETWTNLRSRFLEIREERLAIERPAADGLPPHEFAPGDRLSASFKFKHHKHVFAATVAGVGQFQLDDGTAVPVLLLVLPSKMQRVQRRSYVRVEVPPNRIVRASFWLGGRDAEPAGATPERPVWSGCVVNLSAGGFQVRTGKGPVGDLEIGHTVGVRISFGAGQETVFADAQIRHAEVQGDQAIMGFQFVGLLETPEGQEVVRTISRKVSEYQRAGAPIRVHHRGDD